MPRVFYTHRTTGQRAYLIERHGKVLIKMDTGPNGPERPFTAVHWLPDQEHRPFNQVAIARVAYAADEVLCDVIGVHLPRRKAFESFNHDELMKWTHDGPGDGVRQDLWLHIRKSLLQFASDA